MREDTIPCPYLLFLYVLSCFISPFCRARACSSCLFSCLSFWAAPACPTLRPNYACLIPLSLVFALLYSSVAVTVIGRCFPSSTSPPISFCFRVSLLCTSLLASRPPLPEPSEPRVLPSRYRSSALRWSHVLVAGCGRLSLSQSLSVRWMLRPSLSTTFPSSPHHSPSTNPIFHRTLHSPIRIVHALKRAVKMCSQLRSPTPSHIFVLHCSYLTSSRTRSLAPCALSHSVRR